MPLFARHDGDLVRDADPMRRVIPYLMRRRNDSCVLHSATYRVTPCLDWLEEYNRSHPRRATLFHVFLYACGQTLCVRPGMNRFVSGGRLYQRRGVQLSFVVKREMRDEGSATTVKMEVVDHEPFTDFVARLADAIRDARGPARAVDRETALVLRLPGPLVSAFVGLARLLDAWNLYPRFMTANDPMYASLFLANLGSAGVNDAFHHLYEYGTASLFGAMSAVRPAQFIEDGRVVVRDGLAVHWTFDARIHDGFYAGRSLAVVRQVLEDPLQFLGAPAGAPAFSWTEAAMAPDTDS